jgi:hypothetical protein
MTKEEIVSALRQGIASVEFMKLSGEMRLMDCTLDENVIPKTPDVKEEKPDAAKRQSPTTSLAVWDVEAHGWRSFRWESLMRFNGEEVKVASE